PADIDPVDAVGVARVARHQLDLIGAVRDGDPPPGVGVVRLLHVGEAVVQFVGGAGRVAVAAVGGVVLVPAEGQAVAPAGVGPPDVGQVAGHRLAALGGEVDAGQEQRGGAGLAGQGALAAGVDGGHLVEVGGAERPGG